MAEDDESEGEEGPAVAAAEGSGGSKKKLILLIGVALLLILGGIAGAYFTGMLQPLMAMFSSQPKDEVKEGEPVIGKETVFYDIPKLLVNLNTGERRATFLKIRVSLELGSAKDVPKIEQLMPRVIDNFQVYLRELRIEDLKGSMGVYRLREELLLRVSAAVAPTRINDLLFKEMLIQ